MRQSKIKYSIVLLIGMFFSGCSSVPAEAIKQPADNALISDAFVALMLKGDTTRNQEQAFILANRKAWHAQNFALNEVPLPEDLQLDAEDVNLLDLLMSDVEVRAMLKKVEDILEPDTPEEPVPTPEGE